MSTTSSLITNGVSKTILHSGSELPSYSDGTKVMFHFQTREIHSCNTGDDHGHILDDSRKIGKPMELLLGKQFKMPVWETLLKSMRLGEVAQFSVNKSLVDAYPLVSESYKAFAGITTTKERRCCGMNALKENSSPDSFIKEPTDLEFTMEVLSVEAPGEYEKESWAMAPSEKLDSVPLLKDKGNEFFKQKEYSAAAEKYEEALRRIEQLVLREKPGDDEWLSLEKMKIPLLLNYSQCKLIKEDFYAVIEHTTTVLKQDPDNVKALFRRAKAHVGAWNPTEAKEDFEQAMTLDPSLKAVILKELKILRNLQQQKNSEDRTKLEGKMFS